MNNTEIKIPKKAFAKMEEPKELSEKTKNLLNTNKIKVSTTVKPLGDGYGEIYQGMFSENDTIMEMHNELISKIMSIEDEQTKQALKGLGYIYLSPKWRINIAEELECLKQGSYNLGRVKGILEHLVKGDIWKH